MSAIGDRPPPEHATAWFAAEARSVSAARDYTAAQLDRWGVGQSGIASLVVSELTSNAVRHARSGFELDLSHADGMVRIAVTDESRASPVLQDPKTESDAGRGLQIVAELACEWGFELRLDGKQVWACVSGRQLVEPRPPERADSDLPPARRNTRLFRFRTKHPA